MRRFPLYFFALRLAACGALVSFAGCGHELRSPGYFPVGVTTVSFLDSSNNHPLTVEVWYPAPDSTVESRGKYGSIFLGLAARDAPLRRGKPFPLVVLSHGVRGTRYDLSWLAEGLAADGFIVAAVDHPGSDTQTYSDALAPKLWERSRVLSQVIDGLLRGSRFSRAIDPKRIAAAGHSMGGSTVLVVGGAKVDAKMFEKRFPEAGPLPAPAQRDRRVRAIVAIAPGTGDVFTPAGIASEALPTLIVSGTADWHTPEEGNAAYFAKNLPHAVWRSVTDAAHYTFKPSCSLYGRLRLRTMCNDKLGVDRDTTHAQTLTWTRTFLRKALR